MYQNPSGRWSDRFVVIMLSIVLVLCLKALGEIYTTLEKFRSQYDYLNERINMLEIESVEQAASLRHIEKTIFNDWESME